MVDPFQDPPLDIRFYPVTKELKVADDAWTRDLGRHDLVIAVHYFGFTLESFPWREVCKSGAILVEDSSQALFRASCWEGSYGFVSSVRKFMGVPDGAIFVGSPELTDGAPLLIAPPWDWWATALEVVLRRREFDLGRSGQSWFSLYRQVEASFPLGPFRASDLAVAIIETSTDYPSIAQARRQNFMTLLGRLEEFALLKTLPRDCVPLGFPVLVRADRRAAVLGHLYRKNIYPPIHWNLDGVVEPRFVDSHTLSSQILTLIVDQRYGDDAINWEAESFLEAVTLS